eukprot:TCALIF_09916-PA protein Name:"Similar to MED7 Mediator of RNA polymerase II transcription subunit 7 (Anopheles gambiae)" AED:0.05 eAED:0.05 QI:150/1/1/1/1/1/3/84/290
MMNPGLSPMGGLHHPGVSPRGGGHHPSLAGVPPGGQIGIHAPHTPGASSTTSNPPAGAGGPANPADRESTQVTSMPLPPMQYINHYTDENIRRGTCPPPPPPITDAYSMFGAPFSADDTIIQSLESQGIRRLYSSKDVDRKRELHKLNHSVLVNFLDLLELLIKCPESAKREEKIDETNLLFIHMHHLINEFRPHQARETLRVMLHVQKRRRLQVAEKFQAHLDKVQETIEEALRSLPEQEEGDSKFLIRKESINAMDTSNMDSSEKESCSSMDRLMCHIADELAIHGSQ